MHDKLEDEYLIKLHKDILKVMDEVHRLCHEHGISYYLCGGSLLGAIRHNGFIPWDDDLDIMMPRDDFDKFIKIAPMYLKSEYYLEWFSTDSNYSSQFAKVCIKKTLFQENHSDNRDLDTTWGIFVDVFPIDKTTDNIVTLRKRKNRYNKFCAILYGKKDNSSFCFIKKIICKLFSKAFCYKMLRKIATTKDAKKINFTRFGSQYEIDRVTYPINSIEPGILHSFENREYYIPSDYETNLNTMFGKNYMDIPPENKRRSHFPKKVIFSDGTEMSFDKPSKIISIEDSLN